MWWFLLKSALGSVFGSSFYRWFQNTRVGVWFQGSIDRFMQYVADKYDIELAKKEDVSNAVVFLCSELSGSITGIDLPVDCGVLAESVPTYREVKDLNNNEDIEELSCCGDTV